MTDRKISTILIFILVVSFSIVYSVQNTSESHLYFNDDQKNVGIYLDELHDLQLFRLQPDILAWFTDWYGPIAEEKIEFCGSSNKIIPMITWQPVNTSLQDIKDGYHDPYIISFLQTLTAEAPDVDILIRFAHEMEMRPKYGKPWYDWQGDEPETFIAAWRHVVTLGRAINSNIKWIWSPGKADEYADPYYPGDDYVDYVSVTLNLREHNIYYALFKYKNFEEYYKNEGEKWYLEKYGKKIIIGEASFSQPDQEMKRLYLKSIFDYLMSDPMFAAVAFFNTNKNVKGEQFKFTDNEVYVEEFNQGLKLVHKYRLRQDTQ